jgi:hypothetical protein
MMELLLKRKAQLQAAYRKKPDIEYVIRLREVNLLIKRLTRVVNSGALPVIASSKDVAKELQQLATLMQDLEAL